MFIVYVLFLGKLSFHFSYVKYFAILNSYWEFCKELTKEVQNKLATNKKYVTSHLLGMDEQVDAVLELLDTESGGVRFVGIHGMGGIGKSTLAKVLFNKLSAAFDNSCFLADIRESSGGSNGIENMQRALLGNLGPKLGDMTHNIDLMETIKQKFCKEKVLIVLDDVKDQEQIDKLLGENNCFAPGSRIIVTTRDVRVLQIGGKPFDEIFEVNTMTSTQGMQLFCYHAFRRDSPPHDFKSLSEQVVEHCQGLPLALEVLGSFLCLKDKTVWKDFVDKLNKVLDPTVHGMLRISYEALDIEQQQIFLDIACFFVNTEKSHVAYMWDACGFHPALALDVLVSMSLVKIVEGDKLWMHNLIRDLGRDIARGCGLHQLRNCSRLWGRSSEVMDMLKYKEVISLGEKGWSKFRFKGRSCTVSGLIGIEYVC